jgi:hypothetical protein
MLLGSTGAKAAHRMLMKLTPGLTNDSVLPLIFCSDSGGTKYSGASPYSKAFKALKSKKLSVEQSLKLAYFESLYVP